METRAKSMGFYDNIKPTLGREVCYIRILYAWSFPPLYGVRCPIASSLLEYNLGALNLSRHTNLPLAAFRSTATFSRCSALYQGYNRMVSASCQCLRTSFSEDRSADLFARPAFSRQASSDGVLQTKICILNKKYAEKAAFSCQRYDAS